MPNCHYSFLVNGAFNLGDNVFNLIFREAVSFMLRVQFDPALTLIILAIRKQSDLKSRSNTLIFIEVVLKHASLLRLSLSFVIAVPIVFFKFLDRGHDLPAVASAPAELKLDHVGRILVAQYLAGSRWGT